MTEPREILVGEQRREERILPPSDLQSLWSIFLAGGLALSIAGWTDVLLFYYPFELGRSEWEFATIARTFDALPLPTLGAVLLAVAMYLRGGKLWIRRVFAAKMALVALLCLTALAIFLLDIPVAMKFLSDSGNQQAPVASGIKRGIGKVILFSISYSSAYAWMAARLWRRA